MFCLIVQVQISRFFRLFRFERLFKKYVTCFPHCLNSKPLDLPDCSSSKPVDLPLCSNGKPPDLPDCSINMSHVLSKPLQSSSLNCCTFLKLSVNPISKENINTSLYQSKSVIRSSSSKLSNLLRDTSSQSNCLTSISKYICNSDFSVVCKYKTMNSYCRSYCKFLY